MFFGADRVIPSTPATIAAVAIHSRLPIRSWSIRDPITSSSTRPRERVGCTSVNGASENASNWNGQPSPASPVASSQRGLRTSLPNMDTRARAPAAVGMARTSSAWNTTAPSKQAAAVVADARPSSSEPPITGTILPCERSS